MENEQKSPIDYEAVLADLLAQREELDNGIAAISGHVIFDIPKGRV